MKVAIYARVSTEKQEEEQTINSQIADLERFVSENGHDIIERYIDEGYSGTLLARPDLDRLRDDATKNLFEAVIIHSPDRLARKFIYQGLVAEELKSKSVQIIFLNRPIGETPEDQLLLNVQGVIAEYERTKFVERTRRGRLHKARQGNILGNIPPYGYDCTKKSLLPDGLPKYVINPDESRVVELIFSMLANEGATMYKIVTGLNDLGIKARKGGRWAKSTVGKIVRNETYIGTTYYNKHYALPGLNNGKNSNGEYQRRSNTLLRLRPKKEWIAIPNIPAIILEETFAKAQEQLVINERLSTRNAKHIYLLRGLMKCGLDDRSYYGVPMHGKRSYRCAGKSKLVSDEQCKAPTISADLIEKTVWDSMMEIVDNPKLITQQLYEYKKRQTRKESHPEPQLELLNTRIAKLEEEERRFVRAYGEKVISLEELKTQIMRITEQKTNYQKQRDDLTTKQRESKPIPGAVPIKRYLNRFKPMLQKLDQVQKAQFLRSIIVQILVNDRDILIEGVLPVREEVLLRPQPLARGTTGCWKNPTRSRFASDPATASWK